MADISNWKHEGGVEREGDVEMDKVPGQQTPKKKATAGRVAGEVIEESGWFLFIFHSKISIGIACAVIGGMAGYAVGTAIAGWILGVVLAGVGGIVGLIAGIVGALLLPFVD